VAAVAKLGSLGSMMRVLSIAVLLAMSFVQINGKGKGANRILIYTTQRNYSVVVLVSVGEAQSKVTGRVIVAPIGANARRSVPLRITRSQFDKIWSSFLLSGIDRYPIEKARHAVDLDYYYVFTSGDRKYAVPKSGATPIAVALAKQMEAYANERSVGLQNLPKHVPSTEPERVIVH
jgi:hypothetical protein